MELVVLLLLIVVSVRVVGYSIELVTSLNEGTRIIQNWYEWSGANHRVAVSK